MGQPPTDPLTKVAQAFHTSKRPRGQGWGRQQRPQQLPRFPPQPSQPNQAAEHQIDLLSRLVLKHEEALHHLRKDMAFVLFFRQDDKGLVPNLMEVAKEWRERAATTTPDPALHSPLRTVEEARSFFRELSG